jgi:hypothetical protein
MSLIKGGGAVSFMLFDDAWEEATAEPVELAVAQWALRPSVLGMDVSTVLHRGTRGGTKGYTVDWTVALPVDLPLLPEEAGITVGQTATVWFEAGQETSLWHKLTHTQITFVGPASDATGDLFRLVIQGSHGDLEYYSAEPPGPYA